jgi:hypothetical protein
LLTQTDDLGESCHPAAADSSTKENNSMEPEDFFWHLRDLAPESIGEAVISAAVVMAIAAAIVF